jgi:hypothetical protein
MTVGRQLKDRMNSGFIQRFSNRDRYCSACRAFGHLPRRTGPCRRLAIGRFHRPLTSPFWEEETPRRNKRAFRSCFRLHGSLARSPEPLARTHRAQVLRELFSSHLPFGGGMTRHITTINANRGHQVQDHGTCKNKPLARQVLAAPVHLRPGSIFRRNDLLSAYGAIQCLDERWISINLLRARSALSRSKGAASTFACTSLSSIIRARALFSVSSRSLIKAPLLFIKSGDPASQSNAPGSSPFRKKTVGWSS